MAHSTGRVVRQAEARIQQLCCLGMAGQIVIPAVLKELHDYVPSYANVFCWCDGDGNFVNVYDERPDAAALLPLYLSEFYNRGELEVVKSPRQFIPTSRRAVDSDALLTVDRRRFERHAFYNEYLRKLQFHWGLHMVAMEGERRPGVLIMHRTRTEKPFNGDEARRLDRLSGFLAHAMLHVIAHDYDWVDGEDQGLVITRADGKVEWLSPRARQLLVLAAHDRVVGTHLGLERDLHLPDPVRRICARLGDIRARRPAAGRRPAGMEHAQRLGAIQFPGRLAGFGAGHGWPHQHHPAVPATLADQAGGQGQDLAAVGPADAGERADVAGLQLQGNRRTTGRHRKHRHQLRPADLRQTRGQQPQRPARQAARQLKNNAVILRPAKRARRIRMVWQYVMDSAIALRSTRNDGVRLA